MMINDEIRFNDFYNMYMSMVEHYHSAKDDFKIVIDHYKNELKKLERKNMELTDYVESLVRDIGKKDEIIGSLKTELNEIDLLNSSGKKRKKLNRSQS